MSTQPRLNDNLPPNFEENHLVRSTLVRELVLHFSTRPSAVVLPQSEHSKHIPRVLVRYWHDANAVPEDVSACLSSWDRLSGEGFELRMFDDASAASYIAERYGPLHFSAFERCRHPAMRSDYLRLCFVLAEGGIYVDADDVLLGDGWKSIFSDGTLKLQPLCYDVASAGMVSAAELWQCDGPIDRRIFYMNNDPIAAPAGHPILRRALTRSTARLLGGDPRPEIQETTGPGNMSAAVVAHAHDLVLAGEPFDFQLLRDWQDIAETRWELSYRSDSRNWRNMDM